MNNLPVSVLILTYNEEKNIVDCINSIAGFSNNIYVVDSGSTDQTVSIAKQMGAIVIMHPFENYAKQRNWALGNLSIAETWVLNIDADHRLTPEYKDEVAAYFSKGIPVDICGFMASRKTIFMGRWIKKGGHYPVYHGMLFKKGFGYCEEKEYDQHFVINGKSIILKGDIIDIITDSLDTFITRHNKWASLEAKDAILLTQDNSKLIKAKKDGNPMEQRRYQRMKYYKYPLFLRAFIYFIYRYFFKLGFTEGREGLIFHVLQGFWFRFLVDAKIYESRKKAAAST